MNPVRAFLLSFTTGLAILFSGHGLMVVAFTQSPDQPLPNANVASVVGHQA